MVVKKEDLLDIYIFYIRSIAEYCSVAFHSSLCYIAKKESPHSDIKLKQEAGSKLSLLLLDISSPFVTKLAKIWSMAGLDATEVKKACIVNWKTSGVYRTRDVLSKMMKIKLNISTVCPIEVIGSLEHYLLHCELSKEIKEKFLPKFNLSNNSISSLLNNELALMITLLDPESSLLAEEFRFNWVSTSQIYSLSRDFAYHIHKKFEKFYGEIR